MKEIIKSMVLLQNGLQVLTGGDNWREKNHDYSLAIMQEAAEGIDHLSWKWWAKQEVNLLAAQLEVIDILHFALAHYIATYTKSDLDLAVDVIVEDYKTRLDPVEFHDRTYNFNGLSGTSIELFRVIGGLAAAGRVDIGLIMLLGEKLGLSFDDQTRLYRAKAVLNTFRQHNGYKEGTYRKKWEELGPESSAGPGKYLEDNDIMQEHMMYIDWRKPEAADEMYATLGRLYSEVLSREKRIHVAS